MLTNIFFVAMEFFTAFYSSIPEHIHHFQYLYVGLEGHTELVPWMWTSAVLGVASLVVLLQPRLRDRMSWLAAACVGVVVAMWIEKGLGLVVTGFVPNPLGHITPYTPTFPEVSITLGIYGIGALMITMLYKIALSVRGEVA